MTQFFSVISKTFRSMTGKKAALQLAIGRYIQTSWFEDYAFVNFGLFLLQKRLECKTGCKVS